MAAQSQSPAASITIQCCENRTVRITWYKLAGLKFLPLAHLEVFLSIKDVTGDRGSNYNFSSKWTQKLLNVLMSGRYVLFHSVYYSDVNKITVFQNVPTTEILISKISDDVIYISIFSYIYKKLIVLFEISIRVRHVHYLNVFFRRIFPQHAAALMIYCTRRERVID